MNKGNLEVTLRACRTSRGIILSLKPAGPELCSMVVTYARACHLMNAVKRVYRGRLPVDIPNIGFKTNLKTDGVDYSTPNLRTMPSSRDYPDDYRPLNLPVAEEKETEKEFPWE